MPDALTADAKLPQGRPRIDINLKDVEENAALGMSIEDIAGGLGISSKTVMRRLADDPEFLSAHKRGSFRFKAVALENIHGHAKKNAIAAIFITKHAMGWHDNVGASAQAPQAIKVEISIGQAGAAAVIAPEGDTEPLEAEYEEVE